MDIGDTVHWMTTDKCPLDCKMCFRPCSLAKPIAKINTLIARKLADAGIKEAVLDQFSITPPGRRTIRLDSEPLLSDDLRTPMEVPTSRFFLDTQFLTDRGVDVGGIARSDFYVKELDENHTLKGVVVP